MEPDSDNRELSFFAFGYKYEMNYREVKFTINME